MTSIIAYVRKSRRVGKGQRVASAGDQHKAICEYLPANDLPALTELPGMSEEYPGAFLDNESASKDDRTDRPGWRAVLDALRAGLATVLIVHAVDRASRMGLRHLLHELPPHVRLIAILDGYDSARDDIGAEVMLTVKAREARDYTTKLSARVTDAKTRQRAEGEYSTRPPYGLTRLRDGYGKAVGKLTHHPEQWPIVARIFDEIREGRSLRKVAEGLNADDVPTAKGGAWHTATIRSMVMNDIYAGWLTRRGKATGYKSERILINGRPIWGLADGTDPIPANVVQDARDALSGKAGFGTVKPNTGNRLMSGNLTCDGCAGPMSWNGTAYWRCSRNQSRPGSCPDPVTVQDRHIAPHVVHTALGKLTALDPADERDATALAEVAAAWFGETQTADAADLAEARRTVAEVKQRAARLRKAFLDGLFEDDPDDYERQKAAIQRDRESAAVRLGELEAAAQIDVTWLTDDEAVSDAWNTAGFATRRAILAAALAEVRVFRTRRGGDVSRRVPVEDRVSIRMRWERTADTP
nr:recombinase family protein [Actinomadura rifamycini]